MIAMLVWPLRKSFREILILKCVVCGWNCKTSMRCVVTSKYYVLSNFIKPTEC